MKKNDLLLYKNRPAILKDFDKDKIVIEMEGERKKIREKDAFLLAEDVGSSILDVLSATCPPCNFAEGIELLEGESHSFSSLASLFWSSLPKASYYAAYLLVSSSPFFLIKSPNEILVRTKEEIEKIAKREAEKENIQNEVNDFLQVLKTLDSKHAPTNVDLLRFAPFFQDIEEVALGKKDRLRLIKNKNMSMEKAHSILLKASYWSILKNPYPYRYNKIMGQCKKKIERNIIEEKYSDLTYMKSYAIDNKETLDPDDAISYDGTHLWIHIAIPADTIEVSSEYGELLLQRGRSLYFPDVTHYMMGKEETDMFAIAIKNPSYALSFKLKLDDSANIKDVEVIRSKINAKRLTYEEATRAKDEPFLKPFFEIAKANFEKRKKGGSLSIDIPKVNVILKDDVVSIFPHVEDEAFLMIKEMMLLAGEAAAFFAFKNNIPFQYISQMQPDNMPKKIERGLSGEFQKRRYMKGRSVSTTPLSHASLGLSMYAQVTSPLRRYGDLIAQMQLLHHIDKKPYIPTDELFAKIAMGEISNKDAQLAEKSSFKHFVLVYLLQNPNWTGRATIVSLQDEKAIIFVNDLSLESELYLKSKRNLNDVLNVKVLNIDLPNLLVVFKEIE